MSCCPSYLSDVHLSDILKGADVLYSWRTLRACISLHAQQRYWERVSVRRRCSQIFGCISWRRRLLVSWAIKLHYTTLHCSFLFYSTLLYFYLFYFSLFSSTPLHSSLLYYTLFYSTLLYSTLFYSTVLYSTLLYSTLFYSILLYSTPLYFILLYSILLYSTLPNPTLLFYSLSIILFSEEVSSVQIEVRHSNMKNILLVSISRLLFLSYKFILTWFHIDLLCLAGLVRTTHLTNDSAMVRKRVCVCLPVSSANYLGTVIKRRRRVASTYVLTLIDIYRARNKIIME